MLLQDLIEEYLYVNQARGYTRKTLMNKRHEFKHMSNFLINKRGITNIESVTKFDLQAYVQHKQKTGLQPQSIQSMAKIMTAFFNWCVEEEYLKVNPMDKVVLPKVPKRVLTGFTVEEVLKMIDSFSYKSYLEARNKAIIAMLADCGLRSMEIRGLKNVDVGETILVNGKGNKQRFAVVSPTLKRILIRYERLRKQYFEDRLIRSDNYFLTYQGEGMSHIALYNVIKEAGKRAEVENVRCSPHTFRHFYATQSINSGTNLDIFSLSKLLGHSEIQTTQRYLQSMTDAQLLDKAISSSPLSNLNKRI
ncbi:tyrosine-type recombinase/integrase [Halalkalibacter okhensis]|uniref:Recombinase n=1 Tax=Halalkalibacter okhensis TaxID=333138 RepID=A0A0B0IIM6_9BACI|nr:tyrosine-type recombinase/integrase [Halalkalibacter okhensis]KHF40732.1 recombinase [Halalkalibacter okhensis]